MNCLIASIKKLTKTDRRRKWYEDDEINFDGVSRAWGGGGSGDSNKVPCYQFTFRSLFHGQNGHRPILSLVGDGRIPQLEGDHEIGMNFVFIWNSCLFLFFYLIPSRDPFFDRIFFFLLFFFF